MLYDGNDLRGENFENIYALHFCSVSLGDYQMRDAHRKAIEIAGKKGGIISFDPNLRLKLWNDANALRKAVNYFIPVSDILKISEDELGFITGKTKIEDALSGFFERGVKLVLYTLGSKGAYAFTENTKVFSPAVKVQAVDTTGAGDGFTGAFLWKLEQAGVGRDGLSGTDEKTLAECLDFSNKFCAYSVGKTGAIASYPTLEELNNI